VEVVCSDLLSSSISKLTASLTMILMIRFILVCLHIPILLLKPEPFGIWLNLTRLFQGQEPIPIPGSDMMIKISNKQVLI